MFIFWDFLIDEQIFPSAQVKPSVIISNTLIRRATQSLLKIRKSYKRFLKQRSKAFEARRRRAGGPSQPWWGLGGEAPEKFCDLALLENPWFAYFSIVANAKNNVQEDYIGYKKAFGWYKVIIVKVGMKATC